MLKSILALLMAAVIAIPAFAEPEDMPSRDRRSQRSGQRGRRNAPGFGRGGNMLQRFKAEQDIADKFPEEYAKIEKELMEAERKFNELAKKAKVTVPESFESKIRTLKHKQPKEFAELLKEEDPRAAAGKLMKLAKDNDIELFPMNRRPKNMDKDAPAAVQKEKNNMRRSGRVDFAKLRKEYPEEMKELEALRKTDPEAFRKGLRELNKKMKSSKAE